MKKSPLKSKNKLFNQSKLLTIFLTSWGFNLINLNLIEAKPVTYDFTINVVEGSLKGNTYNGFFSYDDEELTGKETETINAENGLKVCMNFFDQIHNETKDVDYPQYPVLIFNQGKPETLDFWMESPKRSIWWNRNGWNVEITPRENQTQVTNCDCLKPLTMDN